MTQIPTSSATSSPSSSRIASIDLIRGTVMILMAIDHVRVFSGLPAGGPTPGIFFTRWVTHFCAPAFVFLAGTSAFLYQRRHDDLPRFLCRRGLWLVVLELTVLRLAWTFNFDFAGYELAGIIWAIGWCMVLLAGLVRLPIGVVGLVGLLIVGTHNSLDPLVATWDWERGIGTGLLPALWKIAYVGFWAGPIRFGADGPTLIVLYSIIPWIGVMAAGFAFGTILTWTRERRDGTCLAIGAGAMMLFVALRALDLYGDPRPWTAGTHGGIATVLSFLNTTKYPASLQFLLMTLGPTIASIPLWERYRGKMAEWITVFGRVPFFYYILHIPLIHAVALVVSKIRLGEVSPWLFANHPMDVPPAPEGYVWGLPLLYAVFGLTIVALYFPCRWFARIKRQRRDWWLSYL
jgi:uncharacterized membrane protein